MKNSLVANRSWQKPLSFKFKWFLLNF